MGKATSFDMEDKAPRKRVKQACKICSSKRARCSGEKPACASCIANGIGDQCSYGPLKKRGPPKGFMRPGNSQNTATFNRPLNGVHNTSPSASLMNLDASPSTSIAPLSTTFGHLPLASPGLSISPNEARLDIASNALLSLNSEMDIPINPMLLTSADWPAAPDASLSRLDGREGSDAPVMYRGGASGIPQINSEVEKKVKHTAVAGLTPKSSLSGDIVQIDESAMDQAFVAQTFKDLQGDFGTGFSGKIPMQLFGDDHELVFDTLVPEKVHKLLFDTYWQSIHNLWPLLYCPDPALRTHTHYSQWPILYHAICAVVVRIVEPDALKAAGHPHQYTSDSLGQHFFNRARYHLMRSNFDSNIHTVQAMILLGIRENGQGRLTQLWHYIGIATRMLIDLGLHRRSSVAEEAGQKLTAREKEERSRTFWVAYCCDKQTAAILGRPVSLRQDDWDIELPGQFEDQDQDELGNWKKDAFTSSSDAVAAQLVRKPKQSISHLTAFAHLSTILGNILSSVYAVKRKRSYREDHESGLLQDLSSRLQQWHAHLATQFRWVPGEPNKLLPHCYILNLWYWVAVILLHRPFIPSSSGIIWGDTIAASPHWICTFAADCLCDLVVEYQERFGLRVVSGNMVYCIFTSAIMQLANTSNPDKRIADSAKHRFEQLLKALEELSNVWSGASHHLSILLHFLDNHQPEAPEDRWLLESYVNSANNTRATTPMNDMPTDTPDLLNFNSLFASPDNWNTLPVWADLPHSMNVSDWSLFTNRQQQSAGPSAFF